MKDVGNNLYLTGTKFDFKSSYLEFFLFSDIMFGGDYY